MIWQPRCLCQIHSEEKTKKHTSHVCGNGVFQAKGRNMTYGWFISKVWNETIFWKNCTIAVMNLLMQKGWTLLAKINFVGRKFWWIFISIVYEIYQSQSIIIDLSSTPITKVMPNHTFIPIWESNPLSLTFVKGWVISNFENFNVACKKVTIPCSNIKNFSSFKCHCCTFLYVFPLVAT